MMAHAGQALSALTPTAQIPSPRFQELLPALAPDLRQILLKPGKEVEQLRAENQVQLRGATMKRLLFASFLIGALEFGAVGQTQAQIVYGYSTPNSTPAGTGVSGTLEAPQPVTYLTPYPGAYTSNGKTYYSGSYMSGSYVPSSNSSSSSYSPVSVYVPVYPPMISNHLLSPVRMYGSAQYGMSPGFGGMNSWNWMNSWGGMNRGFGGMSPFRMHR
jgi:hypothetical protein